MIVLVCGGRDYRNRSFLFDYMDARHAELPITHALHGGASGADTLYGEWAESRGVQPVVCRPLWDFYRDQGQYKVAGFMRNRRMAELRPHVVYVFPGGTGTADMARTARALSLRVVDVVDVKYE